MHQDVQDQLKEERDKLGAEVVTVQTDREKCIEDYEKQRLAAAAQFTTSPAPKGDSQVVAVLDTQQLPYTQEVQQHPYGIKPVNYECRYPVRIGDHEIQSGECKEGQFESDSYAVKYPKTEEQILKEYYDDVLKRHEEACLKAKEYEIRNKCMPGTVIKEQDDDKELSKNVLVSDISQPTKEKLNPCLIKKQVRFLEPPDKCLQEKEDTCNLKVPTDQCGCTEFEKQSI